MSQKKTVAVVCGGPSSERGVSLISGASVYEALKRSHHYTPHLIKIPRTASAAYSVKFLKKYDVVFNALHGSFGEDGILQKLLEKERIVFTGSGSKTNSIAINKYKTSEIAKSIGLTIPRQLLITKYNPTLTKRIEKTIGFPCIVKPNAAGSSVGVSIIKNPSKLEKKLPEIIQKHAPLVIQEYIQGTETTCGVLGNAKPQALPTVEIIPSEQFFDYFAKYNSKDTKEICPARFSGPIMKKIATAAKKIHTALGCMGLTRSDFILSKNKLYFLEINTSPGMTPASLCPKEAAALSWSFLELVEKELDLAIKIKK